MTLKEWIGICLITLSPTLGVGAASNEALDFKEVLEVLRTNLPAMDEREFEGAAARGLIAQLRPRVMLIPEGQASNAVPESLAALRATLFERSYGYLRPGLIVAGADKKFAEAYKNLATNRLKGLVLDLRFSAGEDYAAAAAIADWFFSSEQPLIDYGEGLRKSAPKEHAISIPIAILVNARTVGAAEALAGILRQNEAGLLLGEHTGGQANIARNVRLTTGQTLRIAIMPVKTGNGNPLPAGGLKPDIAVEVNPEEEIGFVEDAYKQTPRMTAPTAGVGATNGNPFVSTNRLRRRINEADLVRMLRDGQSPESESTAANRRAAAPGPIVQDPVLARALDLLKGLAVVQQTRSL